MKDAKILLCESSTIEYLEIEGFDDVWRDYRRLSPGNWEVRMGESWETCYFDEDALEALYAAWKLENGEESR